MVAVDRHILGAMITTPYRGRAFVYILPWAGPEDLLKVGLTHDPLARWSAFHARWFEEFDIDRAMLLETESRKDAQMLETHLRRALVEFNCPAPLTIRVQAGGQREWHRGAYALARQFVLDRGLEGYFVQPSMRRFLTESMQGVAEDTHAVLQQAMGDFQAGRLSASRMSALGNLMDAHRAFGSDAFREDFEALRGEWNLRASISG